MVMENHQSGKSTELVFNEWEFGAGASDKDFTSSGLHLVLGPTFKEIVSSARRSLAEGCLAPTVIYISKE